MTHAALAAATFPAHFASGEPRPTSFVFIQQQQRLCPAEEATACAAFPRTVLFATGSPPPGVTARYFARRLSHRRREAAARAGEPAAAKQRGAWLAATGDQRAHAVDNISGAASPAAPRRAPMKRAASDMEAGSIGTSGSGEDRVDQARGGCPRP